MQYNVSGFLCPFYACFNALEPKFVICSQFIFLLHCWKIATKIFLLFSFHADQSYNVYAKFLLAGTAVQSESWDNTYLVFYLLCFIFDVLISGLLKMCRHPMLYSSIVIVMKVLLKSDENKYANISNNSQLFTYKMIYDSVTVDHIILSISVEFVQKLKAPNFQFYSIDISNNSQMRVYGMICDLCITCNIILCSSVEFVQKLQALQFRS